MPQAGSKSKDRWAESSSSKEAANQQPQKKHKGKTECCMLCQVCNNYETSKHQVASIAMAHVFDKDSNKRLLHVLLDTGALQGN